MPNLTDRLGGASSSLSFKAPLVAGSTGNLTSLSGFQVIDGVTLSSTMHPDLRRVLVKAQTDASQNGLYEMQTGAWQRTKDFNSVADFRKGTRVFVNAGASQGGGYIVTSEMDPEVFELDDDDIDFTAEVTADAVSELLFQAFQTKAAVEAATITAATLYLQTLIYSATVDGGGARYKRVTSEPAHEGKIRSLDRFLPNGTVSAGNGGWWELFEKVLQPQMFGAVADAATDDADAIQDCIDAADAMDVDVFFPAGTYLLGSSIEIPTGVVLSGVRYQSILKLKNNSVSALTANGDGAKVWIYTDSASNAGLENLVIDGNEDNNTTVFREVSLEGGQNLFTRGVLFKNGNGIALAVSFVTNFELEGLDFQNIVGDFPASPGVPGEGIYVHNCARGLIRGIRGTDIDDHLIYLDGGAGDVCADIHVIDAIGKNCGRVSQSSAFNTYRDVRRSSWTDCHALDCGIGFTAITTVDGTLFPTDLEYNGCTSHETFGTDGADGFSASGVAGRVTMRLRYNDCKAYKSGDGVVTAAHGFHIVGVDDVELNNCTARESNDNGFLLLNCTNFKADVRAINNSRRSDGAFQGMVIGDGTSDNDCSDGTVNIFATDTASGAAKMQDYGLWVRTPSSNIQITGRLEGNITGRLLKDSGVTNVGWSGIYDQGSNSNGHYIRYANGEQECWHTVDATTQDWTTASGAFFTVAAAQTWTFPVAFSSAMVTHITVERPNTELSGVKVHTTSTTTVTYVPFSSASLNTSAAKTILLRAIGRWY